MVLEGKGVSQSVSRFIKKNDRDTERNTKMMDV